MKFKSLLCAAAIAVSAIASGAQANLLVNGSFETGDLTGWTSNTGFGLNPFGTAYGAGMDGTYWHWLSGNEQNITTSQIVSLAAGTYDLTFIMASEFTPGDSLRVSVDGGAGTLFSAPAYNPGGFNGGYWTNWVSQSYSFTATAGTHTITFDTVGLNAGSFDVGLDKVSLDAAGGVPEPATWGLMMVGLGGIGAVLRRRRAAGALATA